MIKAKSNEIRKQQLRVENEQLRQQIELAKQQLIDLETRNGKKQISVPAGQKQNATSMKVTTAPANNVQAASKPAATDGQGDGKQQKKDKPKKEKPATEKVEKPATGGDEAPVDISRLDLRIGRIVEVSKHPDADSLYVEKMDLGEEKPRTIVSGLVKWHTLEEVQNRLVVVFCNLKPAKMRGILSEGMVMCASSLEKVELISPPPNSVPGDLVHCEGYNRNPDALLNPKKKIWEAVAPDVKTNDDLQVCFKGAPMYVKEKGYLKAPTQKGVNVK